MPLLTLASVAELSTATSLLLLAVLQGLTEFLPVSSSGHLVLAQTAMGLDEPAIVVDVALHVGTLFAVLAVYRRDVAGLVVGLLDRRWREPLLIALGTLPAVAVGLFAKDAVERAFESPRTAAWGLLGTATLLAVGETLRRRRLRRERAPVALDARIALLVGLAQACAICPGISRSGSTIAMGLALGLAPVAAARFSFLLAIPAIAGAALLQLSDALEPGALGEPGVLLVAVVVAALVGLAALRFLLAFLGRGAFAWFSGYCLVLGLVALSLLG